MLPKRHIVTEKGSRFRVVGFFLPHFFDITLIYIYSIIHIFILLYNIKNLFKEILGIKGEKITYYPKPTTMLCLLRLLTEKVESFPEIVDFRKIYRICSLLMLIFEKANRRRPSSW